MPGPWLRIRASALAAGLQRVQANSGSITRNGGTDAAAKSGSQEKNAAGDGACCIHPGHFRCRESKSAGKAGACPSRQKRRPWSVHERRRARIDGGDRCTPQRLFHLEFRSAQPARVSIHRHRDLPESGCAARRLFDFGKPFRQRLRRHRHSGVSIGPPVYRCRKGHPEIIRGDRKIGGTSAVPDQHWRTPRSDANRRQWMRNHRRQRAVCRRCRRYSDTCSTGTDNEGFAVPHIAGEMMGMATPAWFE